LLLEARRPHGDDDAPGRGRRSDLRVVPLPPTPGHDRLRPPVHRAHARRRGVGAARPGTVALPLTRGYRKGALSMDQNLFNEICLQQLTLSGVHEGETVAVLTRGD